MTGDQVARKQLDEERFLGLKNTPVSDPVSCSIHILYATLKRSLSPN